MIALDHPWLADGQRVVFRTVLEAWARPGCVVNLGPWTGGSSTALTVLAALCDAGTTFCDVHLLLSKGERGRLGALPGSSAEAAFVLADATKDPGELTLARGTLLAPEKGATLILANVAIGSGRELSLSGPGIDGSVNLRLGGIHSNWWIARERWGGFPMGVDVVLCSGSRAVCLPRHTRIGV